MSIRYYYSGDSVIAPEASNIAISNANVAVWSTLSDGRTDHFQGFKTEDYLEDLYTRYIYTIACEFSPGGNINHRLIKLDTKTEEVTVIFDPVAPEGLYFHIDNSLLWLVSWGGTNKYTYDGTTLTPVTFGTDTGFSFSPYCYGDFYSGEISGNRDGLFVVELGDYLCKKIDVPVGGYDYSFHRHCFSSFGTNTGWFQFLQCAIDEDVWGFRGNATYAIQCEKDGETYTPTLRYFDDADTCRCANGMSNDFYIGTSTGRLFRWNGSSMDEDSSHPWTSDGTFYIQQIIYQSATDIYILLSKASGVGTYRHLFYRGYLNNWTLVNSITNITADGDSQAYGIFPSDDTVIVPDVVGDDLTTASTTLSSGFLTTGDITFEFDDNIATGIILEQDPISGVRVEMYTPVDLTLSAGQVVVPSVSGMELTAANNLLIASGCTPDDITYRYYERLVSGYIFEAIVPSGYVISQDPGAGTTLTGVYNVDLLVSLGVLGILEHMPDRYTWGTTYSPLNDK